MDRPFPNHRQEEDVPLIDRLWRNFCVATAFLTRLPVTVPNIREAPGSPTPEFDQSPTPGIASDASPLADLARASGMFPVVGAVVGAIAALSLLIADDFGLHPFACALISISVATAITGGLHEDGLADFADGLGGGRTPEHRLSIMRDSRIGTFGALALIFSVILRTALLSQMPPTVAAAALIAAGAVSRASLPAVMHWLPPARRDGLAASAGCPEPKAVAMALVLASIIALSLLGFGATLLAVGLAALGVFGVVLMAVRTLGGQTGDVLGAIQQKVEILVFLAVAVVLGE